MIRPLTHDDAVPERLVDCGEDGRSEAGNCSDQDAPLASCCTGGPSCLYEKVEHLPAALEDGWLIRAGGCIGVAFALGLPLLGHAQGSGARLAAIGFAVYGLGGLLGTALALRAVQSPSAIYIAGPAWSVGGLGLAAIGVWPTEIGVGPAAAVAGLAVPAGNTALTAVVTRTTHGSYRRAALAGQQTIVTASSTFGLLVGGPILGLVGPRAGLIGAGGIIITVAVTASLTWRSRD